MQEFFSNFLDKLSEYFAARKGLLPLIGILLVLLNLILTFIPGMGFITGNNIFLHLGVIIAVLGILLGKAL